MKYLLWDFDGTLAYREGKWAGALIEVLRRKLPEFNVTQKCFKPYLQTGFPWHNHEHVNQPNRLPEAWWDSVVPVFRTAFARTAGLSLEEAHHLARCVREVYTNPDYWRLFHDTIPCLQTLRKQGWKHIILSNHVPELPVILEALGLSPYFLKVFNSAETGIEKPHPRAFQNVLFTLEGATNIWMIGDNAVADIAGAQAVGLQGVLVRSQNPGFKYYSKTLSGLVELVNSP